MSTNNTSGTILIRENTPLPANLAVESEVFSPGWRAVRNLDGYGLGRKIDEAKWNFFFLAGEIRAMALGREGLETLRRAVNRVLAKQEGQKFNSLEITKVDSKRFLGIPFTSVAAHFRHIQRDTGLVPAKDPVLKTPKSEPGGGEESQRADTSEHQTALISSS
jgi:hypothetical protein